MLALSLCFLVIMLLRSQTPAAAATCDGATITWDGGAGTSAWSTAANWTPERVPNTEDHVCIPVTLPAVTVSITNTVTVKSVTALSGLSVGGTLRVTDVTKPSVVTSMGLSGTLGGQGKLVVEGPMTWSGGTMADGGITEIAPGGRIDINFTTISAGNVFLGAGRTIENHGTFYWNNANLQGGAGAVFHNHTDGLVEAVNNDRFSNNAGTGTPPLLWNEGIVRQTTDSASISFRVDNDGLIESTGPGSLSLNGGDFSTSTHTGTFGPGVGFTGGTFHLAGATLAGGAIGGANLNLTGTTTQLAGTSIGFSSGTIGGGGTFVVGGTMTWSGGTMAGPGVTSIAPGGRVTINFTTTSAGNVFLGAGRTIDNHGTFYWNNANLQGGDGAVFHNHSDGLVEAVNNDSFSNNAGTGTAPLLWNEGVVRQTTDRSTIGFRIDNDGLIESTGTASLLLTGGDVAGSVHSGTFGPGVSFTGGVFRLDGATLSGVSLGGATFDLQGITTVGAGPASGLTGTISGPGTLVIDGTLAWRDGGMAGTGVTRISPTGRLEMHATTISAETLLLEAGRTIRNEGTIWWSNATLQGAAGSVLRNAGLIDIVDAEQFTTSLPTGGTPPLLHNEATGTIRKTASDGRATIRFQIDNDGLIESVSNAITMTGGDPAGAIHQGTFGTGVKLISGTWGLNGATLTGVGIGGYAGDGGDEYLKLTGTTTIGVGPESSFHGGTIGGTGTLEIAGSLAWTGATMADAGVTTVLPGGRLELRSTDLNTPTVVLGAGRELLNKGAVVWTKATISAQDSSVIRNVGTFEINSGNPMSQPSGTVTPPLIINDGVFHKKSGGSTSLAADFENNGTLRADAPLVLSGKLHNFNTSRQLLSGGTYELSSSLRFPNANIQTNAADIRLSGTAAALTDSAGADAFRSLARNARNGVITVESGAVVSAPGTLSNSGSILVRDSSTMSSAGAYSQDAGSTVVDGASARLVATSGGIAVTGGRIEGTGTLQGSVSNSGGTIAPGGDGVGTLTIDGPFAQSLPGAMEIDVTDAATHDALTVTTASLAGGLDLMTSPEAELALDSRIPFLAHSSTRSGFFSPISGVELGNGTIYQLENDPGAVVAAVRTEAARQWGAVTINDGAEYTNRRAVSLGIKVPIEKAPATGIRVANDADPSGTFASFMSPMAWSLSSANGSRTVRVQLRDAAGNESWVVSDDIVLDTIAPIATIGLPASSTSAVPISFNEPVTAVSSDDVAIRVTGTDANLPAEITCQDAAGAYVQCFSELSVNVWLKPAAPLVPGASYTVWVNPADAANRVVDRAGNQAVTTSRAFSS